MAKQYTITLTVTVTDSAALYAAALKHATEIDGLSETQALSLLNEDGAPNTDCCLQMIFDPGVSPEGVIIESSEVEPSGAYDWF